MLPRKPLKVCRGAQIYSNKHQLNNTQMKNQILTKKELRVKLINLLTESMRTEQASIERHNLIVKAAELNKGAINTRLLKHLPEGWSFNNKYNMYHLVSPQNNTHLIGWVGSTFILTPEGLRHSDSCHAAGAEERIEKIKSFLEDTGKFNLLFNTFYALQKAFNEFKRCYQAVETNKLSSFHNPIFYDICRAIGLNTSPLHELFKG